MTRVPAPPRLAERLVTTLAKSDPWTGMLEGDLREEHAEIVERRGWFVAASWYWLQLISLVAGNIANAGSAAWLSLRSFLALGDRPVSSFSRDIVRAARALARQPLVTAAIIVTLGLGLGVNAAAFQLVNAFILNPLPGVHTDGLTMMAEIAPGERGTREMVAPGNYYDWRRDARSFSRLALFDWWEVNLAGGSEPERILGFRVTADFFPMLHVTPQAGRFLSVADEQPGAEHVIVLSDALWRRRFGARTDVVGSSLRIDDEPYTVVGVGPAGFGFPLASDAWSPFMADATATADHTHRSATVMGELAPGVTLAQAAEEMRAIYARERTTYQHPDDGLQATVRTLNEGMRDDGSPEVVTLVQIAALLVLLIGGTNIANLLIARGWDRQRETALRLAIGASRAHVLRQFAIESLVLGLPAVPLALGLSWVSLQAMRATMPARIVRFIPGWVQLGVDWRLGVITLVAAVACAFVFSIVPAWQTSRPALVQALGQGGRGSTTGARRQRFRSALVVAEIALALPLLVAAGLATLAARTLANGPQGFDPSGIAILHTQLPEHVDPQARRDFSDRLLARISAVPGVQSAGTVNHLPSSDASSGREIAIEGVTIGPREAPPMVVYRVISPGYLQTMRIPIQRGRDFGPVDREDGAPVAIISAAMAHKFWPDVDPIGRRLRVLDKDDSRWITVVGIAGNIIDDWFDRRNASMLYVPAAQRPNILIELAARTTGDPAAIAPDLRRALRDVDPLQPGETMLMSTMVAERTIGLRMIGAMMATLGALALVLAAIGIYSLMSYYVSQRRQEIGVRLALGASHASVVGLTVGAAGRLAAIGLVLGLALAIALARAMEGALFGTVTAEPSLFIAIAAMLAATALVASLVPARQAAAVDPALALRSE
jgi:putative ABC transport system permease protein